MCTLKAHSLHITSVYTKSAGQKINLRWATYKTFITYSLLEDSLPAFLFTLPLDCHHLIINSSEKRYSLWIEIWLVWWKSKSGWSIWFYFSWTSSVNRRYLQISLFILQLAFISFFKWKSIQYTALTRTSLIHLMEMLNYNITSHIDKSALRPAGEKTIQCNCEISKCRVFANTLFQTNLVCGTFMLWRFLSSFFSAVYILRQ